MRNDYRRDLKAMTDSQLIRYIDRKTDYILAGGDELNRLIYAKKLAEKRNIKH